MKIYNPIGSKERLVEMFQRVNKIKLNEDLTINNTSNEVVENAFNQLKNNQLKIQNTNNQITDNESFVELNCVDESGNNINFKFRATSSQGEQEGVFNVDNVELIRFAQGKSDGSIFEIDESMLKQFNVQHKNELLEIVSNYVDFDEGKPETDDLYEEAIKLIDKVPYNNGTERLQKHKAYVDEKPTNSNVKVNSPELNKFVNEDDGIEPENQEDDPLAMPNDYDDEENIENDYDDVDKSYMGTLEVGDDEGTPEEQELFNQAFENLMARNKSSKNLNYYPTGPEIEREVERLSGLNKSQEPEDPYSHMAKGKKRVYPAWADKYLGENNLDVDNVEKRYFDKTSSEFKNKIIQKAVEIIDNKFGVKIFSMSKEEYNALVKNVANKIYQSCLMLQNEGEYPSSLEIPKVIEPKKNYPKEQKKRHKIKKLKVQENEEPVSDKNSGKSLNIGDVVTVDGIEGEFQVGVKRVEGKPFLMPFDMSTKKANPHFKIYLTTINSPNLTKVLDFSETEGGFMFENSVVEMSTYRNLNNVDINKHKAVLVHLWSGSPSGVKVALFVPATNNETNERIWTLYPKKPIGFVSYDMVNNPEYAYIEGSAAKEFLRQQGYKIKNDTKMIKRIQESEENDGMSLEPEIDNIEKLAQDREELGDQINGGLGDDKSPLEFEPEQIKLGMKVEMEHTDDPMIALEIALDHLTEDPKYYTVKDDPEASAQANASQEASSDEVNNHPLADILDSDGTEEDLTKNYVGKKGINRAIQNDDKDLTDELLGYKPKNVGEMDEEIVGSNGAESVVGGQSAVGNTDDEYKKYQEYEKKDFNTLPDNDKEEFFNLWKMYKKNQ